MRVTSLPHSTSRRYSAGERTGNAAPAYSVGAALGTAFLGLAMNRHDWYRNTTWSPDVQAAFYDRLHRARGSFNKAQYLRIQAACLAEAGHYEPALQLLDEMLRDHPDPSQLASARLQRGDCLVGMQRVEEAVDEYRHALQAEREYPTVKTGAWLSIACVIAFYSMHHLYDEALRVLDEFGHPNGFMFPTERFKYAAALAFIADARGDHETARRFANAALESAAATHSGIRRHPHFGLVENLDEKLHQRLVSIAGV